MVVYWVRNTVNDKVYVGQTSTSLEKRWYMHTWDKNTCSLLHKAIDKYGKENFSIEILHECMSQEEMNFVEIFYISFLNTKSPNGYNLTEGGGGRSGFSLSDETKKKISIANTGKPPHPRLLDQSGPKNHMFGKISFNRGKKASEETRKLMSQAGLGKKKHTTPHTEETKALLSAKTKALWENPEYAKHMSEVHSGNVKEGKAYCVAGHERTPENVYDSGGCKICAREKSKQRYWRIKNVSKQN